MLQNHKIPLKISRNLKKSQQKSTKSHTTRNPHNIKLNNRKSHKTIRQNHKISFEITRNPEKSQPNYTKSQKLIRTHPPAPYRKNRQNPKWLTLRWTYDNMIRTSTRKKTRFSRYPRTPHRPPSADTPLIRARPGSPSSLCQGDPSLSGVWDGHAIWATAVVRRLVHMGKNFR